MHVICKLKLATSNWKVSAHGPFLVGSVYRHAARCLAVLGCPRCPLLCHRRIGLTDPSPILQFSEELWASQIINLYCSGSLSACAGLLSLL